MDFIERANTLVETNKNYRKTVKFIDGIKVEMFTYIIADYKSFKENNSFFMRGFGVINDNQPSFSVQKFFNLNENEDWVLDDSTDISNARIFTKFDGTLIIPFIINDKVYFRTKMELNSKYTDLAKRCLTKELDLFIKQSIRDGKTPIFELISPLNRIVVNYEKTELKLIGFIIDNEFTYHDMISEYNFKTIKELKDYINKIENFEGVILEYNNKIYKLKTDSYVELHKCMSDTKSYKNIFELVLNEKMDDLKAKFDETTLAFVNEIESKIIDKINTIYNTLENLDYKLERKEFALKYKHMGFIFSIAMKNYSGLVDDLLVEIKNVLLKTYNTESKIKEFLECL